MATDMKMQGFYLDKDNEERLEEYSKQASLSKSEVVRRALKMYLSIHEEDLESVEAAKALARKKRVSFSYVLTQAIYKAVPSRYFKKI